MSNLLAIIIVLQLVIIVIFGFTLYVYQRYLYTIDASRIAERLATSLLRDYKNDLHLLNKGGVINYARQEYGRLSSDYGLPMSAIDAVCYKTWDIVKVVRGDTEEIAAGSFTFYE